MTDEEPVVPTVRDIDEHANLWNRYLQCAALEKSWKEQKELAQEALKEIVGDAEEARINGRKVFTYAREQRFQSGDFKKQYPDMYKLYLRPVTKQEFDLDGFKLTRPELFADFQTRSFRVAE